MARTHKVEKKRSSISRAGPDFDLEAFRSALVNWFEANKRELPWRQSRHPYLVWISEIMLQQTQVQAAIGYFNRFMEKFPTVDLLAKAPLQEVLKVWEGLGYYSRARNLHKAAQLIVSQHNGQVPNTKESLLRLPGIGRYTAGAILSLAFDIPEPVLDGNVLRVLSRLFAIEEPVDHAKTKEILWRLAETLLPQVNPGKHNEALMELGSEVCTPRDPKCEDCPMKEFCRAFSQGRQAELPHRVPRKKVPHFHVAAGVIWQEGKILVTLRPTNKMLGGLWEFPGGKCQAEETLESCLIREIDEELKISIRVRDHFMDVKHAYSHFKITLHMFHCDFLGGHPKLEGVDAFQWVAPEELLTLPFPAADGRVIRKILEEKSSGKL